jgi:hypothetical protein
VLVHGVVIGPDLAPVVLEALELLQRRDMRADPALVRLAEELSALADPRPTSWTAEPVWLTIEEYARAANVSGRTARRHAALTPGARKDKGRWQVPRTIS